MKRVVYLDWGFFVHKAIFSWNKNRAVPPTYTALSMIFGCLRRIELSREDLIIIATDSPKGSWRRDEDPQYKANRKANREKFQDINWKEQFNNFNKLLKNLSFSTPFFSIQIDSLEADDIISYGTRFFKDYENIIISSDGDYEMLMSFPNVQIFSPITKKYKIVKDPYSILCKKIMKERSDNLISTLIDKKDYEKRERLVSLLKLPDWVEQVVEDSLIDVAQQNKEKKYYNIQSLMHRSLIPRFEKIYDNSDIVTVFDSLKSKKKKKKIKIIPFSELEN